MNETKFHISLVTAATIFFAAALSMCLSTATGADLYTSPRSDLMWIIDGDTCLRLAKSDSHVTPPVRGVFGMREVFWQGKEYTRETLPNGEVAKRLANQRFWPPHMPAKTVGKPFLTLDHEKIITRLAFGRQGSSAGFVKAGAIGEIYEPLPLAESESGRN